MNRVLRRPMFRTGGVAEGITSGLDYPQPNASRLSFQDGLTPLKKLRNEYWGSLSEDEKGSVAGQNEYVNSRLASLLNNTEARGNDKSLREEYNERRKLLNEIRGPRKPQWPQFATEFGLNLLSTEPQGNIFQTAALAAQDPYARMRARMAERESGEDKLSTAILGDLMDIRAQRKLQREKLEGEKAISEGELASKEKIAFAELTSLEKRTADQIAGSMEETKALIKAEEEKGIQANTDKIAQLKEKYKLEEKLHTFKLKEEEKYGVLGTEKFEYKGKLTDYGGLIDEGTELINKLTELEDMPIGPFGKKDEAAIRKVKEDLKKNTLLQAQFTDKEEDPIRAALLDQIGSGLGPATWAHLVEYDQTGKIPSGLLEMAEGGRVGYQMGGATMPGGMPGAMPAAVPAAMTTDQGAEQDGPVQNLSFEELRARLPKEITDDIIQLIANSKQALVDFANIRTQQDVNAFNQKYDVNLVAPQEA